MHQNTTESDEVGAFHLPALSPGSRLSVTANGFEATVYEVKDPSLPAEIVMMLDPLLQPVTVLHSSPLISANPEISTAIDTRTVSELPSSIRDINRFAMLDPRVRNIGSLGTDGIYGTSLTVNGPVGVRYREQARSWTGRKLILREAEQLGEDVEPRSYRPAHRRPTAAPRSAHETRLRGGAA